MERLDKKKLEIEGITFIMNVFFRKIEDINKDGCFRHYFFVSIERDNKVEFFEYDEVLPSNKKSKPTFYIPTILYFLIVDGISGKYSFDTYTKHFKFEENIKDKYEEHVCANAKLSRLFTDEERDILYNNYLRIEVQ